MALVPAGRASAWTLAYHDPLLVPATGKPFSCPDPSVTYAVAPATGYVLVCTSAYERNAFPIYLSQDLIHWQPDGFVFPHGHQPRWAVHSGGGSGGRYWAPEINRVGDRWVIYFAAEYNAKKIDLEVPGDGRLKPRTMVIGYATATSLQGPWRSGVLHYRGQFNNVSAERESLGPAIDPSAVEDPSTGTLYLFWADESAQIWAGELSPDGTTLDPQIHLVLRTGEPFDCDPRDHHCTPTASATCSTAGVAPGTPATTSASRPRPNHSARSSRSHSRSSNRATASTAPATPRTRSTGRTGTPTSCTTQGPNRATSASPRSAI